jgi:hypothetical protein
MNDKDKEALNIFWNKWRENWLKMDHRQIPENPTLVVLETWQAALVYARQETSNNDSEIIAKLNQENKKLREAIVEALKKNRGELK